MKRNRILILAAVLSLVVTATAQINISWKRIEAKPLYLPIGQGGPENYKEEVGGYDLVIDLTKNPNVKVPYTIELSFYRERDPWHPVYTDKDYTKPDFVVDWQRLQPEPITVSNYDNTIRTGSSSDDPKEFKQTDTYTIECDSKKTVIFIPAGWCAGNYGPVPTDAQSCILRVVYYPHINVYSNNQCLKFNWHKTPYIYFSYDFCPHGNTYEDLGSEDLSSLFDDETPKLPNQQASGIIDIPQIPTPQPKRDDNKPTGKQGDSGIHHHKFHRCLVTKDMDEGNTVAYDVYPKTVVIPIGDIQTTWRQYSNDSICLGYVLESPSPISEKLWMTIMDGRSEQQFDNPSDRPVTDIRPDEMEIFTHIIDSIKPHGYQFKFEYCEGIPNDILVTPSDYANFGEKRYKRSYYVYVHRTYCCTCGEEHTYHSRYLFFTKDSATAFVKRK